VVVVPRWLAPAVWGLGGGYRFWWWLFGEFCFCCGGWTLVLFFNRFSDRLWRGVHHGVVPFFAGWHVGCTEGGVVHIPEIELDLTRSED